MVRKNKVSKLRSPALNIKTHLSHLNVAQHSSVLRGFVLIIEQITPSLTPYNIDTNFFVADAAPPRTTISTIPWPSPCPTKYCNLST